MIFGVERRGETVGTVEVTEEARVIRFAVDCVGGTPDIVRCYGKTGGEPLLLGVLEPQDGRLRLTRAVTRQTLAQHGGAIPQAYYLSGGPEDAPAPPPQAAPRVRLWTGDPALDAALAAGEAEAEETASGLRLRCAFEPGKPFALACAAGACAVMREKEKTFAVLELRSPFYRTGEVLE